MKAPRHFLDLDRVEPGTLRGILDAAAATKRARAGRPRGEADKGEPLKGKLLAMIFDKPSTRTRVSFDVAMRQLGGATIVLNSDDMQLGRGETVSDTARVLSRYVDAIMIRTRGQQILDELAAAATVPVINGLTDASHPCQLMADVMTFEEHRGPIAGKTIAWTGDGNNVAASWIHAAQRFKFELRLACPEQLSPPMKLLNWARTEGATISLHRDPEPAVAGADCVVTDTWLSMGQKEENRHNLLAPFRVDAQLMARAKPNAIFMHCLPAHRGDEVTADIIEGPRSVVWDEAENRLHAQKAILAWCLS